MHYQWLDQASQINDLAEQIGVGSVHALDTEFIKVDTLYPKLGVVQLNLDRQVYLIDGQQDLSQLWQALFRAKQNIFHACSEDLDLIYHFSKQAPLDNVFDSQVAMAFLGYGLQVGYQAALAQVLAIDVDKDQTRSDWLARPLSPEQLRYAAADVYYLPQLAQRLQSELNLRGHMDFVLEDCQSFAQQVAYKPALDQVYLDVANYRHSSRQLMQLKQLCGWREQLAISLNKPRSFILKNNVIQQMLEKPPHSMQQLFMFTEIKPAVLREHGKSILALLNDLGDKSLWPARLPKPYRFQQEKHKLHIEQFLLQHSRDTGIPVDVLMRKKWLNQLIEHVRQADSDFSHLSPYLRGWRWHSLSLPLLDLIAEDFVAQRVNI